MSRKKWYRRFPSLKPPKKFKTDDMLIIVRRLKFAEGQRHVEGIFPGFEIRRPIAVPVLWIINTAETQPPLVVPVTDIVRDKGVVYIRGFSDPKEGGYGRLESTRAASH